MKRKLGSPSHFARVIAFRRLLLRAARATGRLTGLPGVGKLRDVQARREVVSSGLFDAGYYADMYRDVARRGIDPAMHYVKFGCLEGRAPHPLFDPRYYSAQHPDVQVERAGQLRHFIRHWRTALSSPHPWFDTAFYIDQDQRLKDGALNPLIHYLREGGAAGLDPHPDFDTRWYRETYEDAEQQGTNPLAHYVRWGQAKGYRPNSRALDSTSEAGAAVTNATARPITAGHQSIPDNKCIKLVAFYLPQFHPIPENDAWWGKGFTEWRSVTRAKALYGGHHQPRLPTDLGFYDLRVPETRQAQVDLARAYGISAFCYYYYWFDGRRILERPLDDVLASGVPEFPFCICWANENWSRRWDGLDHDVLLHQSYSPGWDRRFIRDVIPVLADQRYLRYGGKPVLIVYRVRELPDVHRTLETWRTECRSAGLGEIHIAGVRFWDIIDVQALGFDAAVDFPPHHLHVRDVTAEVDDLNPAFTGLLYDYRHAALQNLERRGHGYAQLAHRGVMLAWDNTPRRGAAAHIAHGASPELYHEWLRGVVEQEMLFNPERESLVFINAWNEWGEGAVLEPDSEFGHGFLEATRSVATFIRRHGSER